MWAATMENATGGRHGGGGKSGMRETDPAWRSRDLPPSENMLYAQRKIVDWLDRGGNINTTAMDKERGHSFLIAATINNNESLVAELLRRGAEVDLKAQGKAALHFAAVLGHASIAEYLIQYGASTSLRVDVDDTDYTECDGMTALEIVEEKAVFARDPVKERLVEMGEMLRRAAARGQ